MFKDIDKHDEVCLFKVIPCKNDWGKVLERQEHEQHYQLWELEPIKCIYAEFGWECEIIRQDYKQHLEDMAYEHSLMFVHGQKRINQENDELKRELLSLRKDYDVEIKAMFLELNRVKDELSQLKQWAEAGDRNAQNPLNQARQNSTFEKKIPNARYHDNNKNFMMKNDMQYAEGNNSSLESCLFEYSSRSRIYGD